jgi:hypothetical protein
MNEKIKLKNIETDTNEEYIEKIIIIPKFNFTKLQNISCKNIFLKKNILYYNDFKTFLEKEHSIEYLFFYNDVNIYKRMSTDKTTFASMIFEKYFNNDSKYEINTSYEEKETIKSNLSNNKDDIFDQILKDVVEISLLESMERYKSIKKFI